MSGGGYTYDKGCYKRDGHCACGGGICGKEYRATEQPSPSTGGEPATDSAGRDAALAALLSRIDAAAEAICYEQFGTDASEPTFDRLATLKEIIDLCHGYEVASKPEEFDQPEAAREPAPVARELDVEAERREFEVWALRISLWNR